MIVCNQKKKKSSNFFFFFLLFDNIIISKIFGGGITGSNKISEKKQKIKQNLNSTFVLLRSKFSRIEQNKCCVISTVLFLYKCRQKSEKKKIKVTLCLIFKLYKIVAFFP